MGNREEFVRVKEDWEEGWLNDWMEMEKRRKNECLGNRTGREEDGNGRRGRKEAKKKDCLASKVKGRERKGILGMAKL